MTDKQLINKIHTLVNTPRSDQAGDTTEDVMYHYTALIGKIRRMVNQHLKGGDTHDN